MSDEKIINLEAKLAIATEALEESNRLRNLSRKHFEDADVEVLKLQGEVNDLEAKLATATVALEFYAHVDHWNRISQTAIYTVIGSDDIGDGSFQFNEDVNDDNVGGKKARQALAEIKGDE